MAHGEATKNHPGGVSDVSSKEKYARMYETEDPNDGYKVLELYLSKLYPKCDSFFNIHEKIGVSETTYGMKRVPSKRTRSTP